MGRGVKYTKEILEDAVRSSTSIAGVLRMLKLKPAGGTHSHISRRIKKLGLDTTHFTGQAHHTGRPPRNRLEWAEILTLKPVGSNRQAPKRLRRALIESGRPHRCSECTMEPIWCGRPLVFHVDHIDGNPHDSLPTNVRFLCPNCHSQTPTWAGRRRFGDESDDRGA